MSEKLIHIDVTHEAEKPLKIVKMIATKQFKKKHPNVAFGKTTDPVSSKDLADGKKLTTYGFKVL